MYSELGNNWNLTVFPNDEDMEVDYTYYAKPKKPIYLSLWDMENRNNVKQADKDIFLPIMHKWYELSKATGDIGPCVLGAGMSFEYNNSIYFMSACSPWQGSCSWESHVETIKEMLRNIGCTNIYFNYGRLD